MHGSHSCLSSFEQAVVTLPLRSQSAGSPIQVQASRGQASLTVPGLASAVTVTKPQTSSPASPAHNPTSPAVLQGVSSQNIIKQVQADSECIRLTVSMGMHNISVSYCLLANVKKVFISLSDVGYLHYTLIISPLFTFRLHLLSFNAHLKFIIKSSNNKINVLFLLYINVIMPKFTCSM